MSEEKQSETCAASIMWTANELGKYFRGEWEPSRMAAMMGDNDFRLEGKLCDIERFIATIRGEAE